MKDLKRTTLEIEGMTCRSCVRHVDDALRSVAGVVEVNVAMREGAAHVVYNADETSPAVMTSAVQHAGYAAREEMRTA